MASNQDQEFAQDLPGLETYYLVTPRDTNHHGNIHGGDLVRVADNLAWTLATRFCRMKMVTARIKEWKFNKPVKVGDNVILNAELLEVKRTAIEIKVTVQKETLMTGEITYVANGFFTMVAVDDDGKLQRIKITKPDQTN